MPRTPPGKALRDCTLLFRLGCRHGAAAAVVPLWWTGTMLTGTWCWYDDEDDDMLLRPSPAPVGEERLSRLTGWAMEEPDGDVLKRRVREDEGRLPSPRGEVLREGGDVPKRPGDMLKAGEVLSGEVLCRPPPEGEVLDLR